MLKIWGTILGEADTRLVQNLQQIRSPIDDL
jgi:hypothetical protein